MSLWSFSTKHESTFLGKKHGFSVSCHKIFTATLYREIFNIAQLIIYEATLRLEYFSCPIAFAIEGRRIPRKTKNNLWNSPRLCLMECIQSNFNNPWPDHLWQCMQTLMCTQITEARLNVYSGSVGLGWCLRFLYMNISHKMVIWIIIDYSLSTEARSCIFFQGYGAFCLFVAI